MSDHAGEWGSGAGKGGGAGGSIRESGGSFGRMEAAREEEYFRKQQRKQLEKLKDSLGEEISFHKKQIEMHKQAKQLKVLHDHLEEEVSQHKKEIIRHQEAIDRHKKKISQIKDVQDDD